MGIYKSNISFANTCVASRLQESLWLATCCAIAFFSASDFAYAHHQRATQNTSGITIPNIRHQP